MGDSDAALALELQPRESAWEPVLKGGAWEPAVEAGCDGDNDMAAALAGQIEEEGFDAQMDDGLREAQFRQYEEQLTREDAEQWHGRGDLMQGGFQRSVLSLETMDKATCYSIGHGRM